MIPERLTEEIEVALDAAEIGNKGCLIPLLDDPTEGGFDEGDDD